MTELRTRAVSGVIAAVPALACIVAGGMWFALLILLASVQMIREWDALTPTDSARWRLGGAAYVVLPALSLLSLRNTQAGLWLTLFLMFVVWATDIGAYFAGRGIGGPKLAPRISPGKTWAGLGGGMLTAALLAALLHRYTPFPLAGAFLLGALLAAVAQAGDLFESWLKRRAGVKDSGRLIPGHGGLLDRIDGLAFAAPVFALSVFLSGTGA